MFLLFLNHYNYLVILLLLHVRRHNIINSHRLPYSNLIVVRINWISTTTATTHSCWLKQQPHRKGGLPPCTGTRHYQSVPGGSCAGSSAWCWRLSLWTRRSRLGGRLKSCGCRRSGWRLSWKFSCCCFCVVSWEDVVENCESCLSSPRSLFCVVVCLVAVLFVCHEVCFSSDSLGL